MAGPSRSIAGGSLHLTTYEQRQQMITRIHFIFGLFAAFAIFDFCSGAWNETDQRTLEPPVSHFPAFFFWLALP